MKREVIVDGGHDLVERFVVNHANDPFRLKLLRLLSQETSRLQFLATILATMRAEMRLASFLLDLSQRYSARGFSASELVLRLTRQEIGSYLGIKLETVSRCSRDSSWTACSRWTGAW